MMRITDGDQQYDVDGRLASIIRWLLKRRDYIKRGNGRLHLIFTGTRLKGSIELEEEIE